MLNRANLEHKTFQLMIIPCLLLLFSFLSYQENLFRVISDPSFNRFQYASEILVIDGLNYTKNTGKDLSLGHYERLKKTIYPDSYLLAKKSFNGKLNEKETKFDPYTSQIGLQLYFYSFLSNNINMSIQNLKQITSLLMSFVVLLFYFPIKKEFGFLSAIGFSVIFIFSPWVVTFSNNLYWAMFTWFIPILITFYLSHSAFKSSKRLLIMSCLLIISFLIKFLCGYEYITTIAITSCLPIFYWGFKTKVTNVKIIYVLSSVIFSFLAAFIISLVLYSSVYGSSNLEKIVTKRVLYSDIQKQINDYCKDNKTQDCKDEFIKDYAPSLNANPIKVVATYFKFRSFLPWSGPQDGEVISADKIKIKKWIKQPYLYENIINLEKQSYKYMLETVLNMILFLIFNILICRKAMKSQDKKDIILIATAFLAPISWYALAKGHSYLHTHINYILWYILYVPLGMAYLLKNDSPCVNRTVNQA
ncbi:hypothetical protein Ping_0446 [Psychromonas ingrahamii 37]|uniref:Glycosyltransferase RgtA/B/C/D-like domain-containing protein n=1 Tax=Psychromonas ingrahamii (strain DSM 17664 / CCUG 51855 / 37) TaxID=357804 RepID=A1SS39_PSYIN|nr:hypothetical protein [Psychromonas ingrahamii]ABM02304.1 hypothetical protein Ping_0446 [Psychromonas ingrahamii 37]